VDAFPVPENFFIEEITFDADRSSFIPKRFSFAHLQRLFDCRCEKVYARMFRTLLAASKRSRERLKG
jgi:hypothetical protein